MIARFSMMTGASALALVLAAGAAHAAGKVEVKFTEPERFADSGRFGLDRERNLELLSQYLQKMGEALPDGQVLQIEVLDVDLAGESRPRSGNEIRIVRGAADWPRIQLRYALQEGTRTVKSGEQWVTDLAYTFNGLRGTQNSYEMAYERRMLRAWFDKTVLGRG